MQLWLNTVGLALGLLGSVILAFSLNGVLSEIALAINFIDTALEGMLSSQGDILRARGLQRRLDRATRKSSRWTIVGLIMLAAAFGLQLIALYAQKPAIG